MARRRLVFTSGYQRSGTTVLFRSVEASHPGIAFNESPDNPLFVGKNLKRQVEILELVDSIGGLAIAKANKLFSMYSCAEIASRYPRFQLYLIWAFRDPVDVYASHWAMVSQKPTTEHPDAPDEAIIEGMNERNRNVLDAAKDRLLRVLFLSHDDMSAGRDYRPLLQSFAGLTATPKQKPVASKHSGALPSSVATHVRDRTREIYDAMWERYAWAHRVSAAQAASVAG
jgi:hypothetical protein